MKSCSINHGGKASNFTVPNPTAQAHVIAEAIGESGVNPSQLSYIEAHGTGTSLGDPIEINGLSRALSLHTNEKQFCAIGSVKSNIGHCESAAGIAGLTKILLQMQYKTLVPSIHCDELNPNINFENSPFVVQRELSNWENLIDNQGGTIPLTAGLSSFGAGGSNAHLIVSEYIDNTVYPNETRKNKPILLSARTPERLKVHVERMKRTLEKSSDHDFNMDEFSYTLQVGREAMLTRVGFIANTREEAIEQLDKFLLFGEDASDISYYQINPIKDSARIDEFNRDSQPQLTQWLTEQNYVSLIDAWVKGADIDWSSLYSGNTPRKITLPFYPFEKDRCWIDYSPKVIREQGVTTPTPTEQQNNSHKKKHAPGKTYSVSNKNEDNKISNTSNKNGFDINNIIDMVNHDDMTEDKFLEWIADQ